MKNSDLFELESKIENGGRTKHWPLLEPLDDMLATVRSVTSKHRAALEPTAAIQKFKREMGQLRAQNAAEKQEVVDEKLRALVAEHPQAQIDAVEQNELENDMMNAEVDAEIEGKLKPIAKSLFHDKGVLRVEPELFFCMRRLGLIVTPASKE